MSESIADLRARLKSAKPIPALPPRTCIEILLRLEKDGRLVTPLIFSANGQELLTRTVLAQELRAVLSDCPRVRISELVRQLGVAEEPILEVSKHEDEILVLAGQELIHNSYFPLAASQIEDWLTTTVCRVSFSQIADRLNLPLTVVDRVIPLLGSGVEIGPNSVSSIRHLELVRARLRGMARGLRAPRDVATMTTEEAGLEFLKSSQEILQVGFVNSANIFVPHRWLLSVREEVDIQWRTHGWVKLAQLQWLCSKIPDWAAAKGDFLILDKYLLSLTDGLKEKLSASFTGLWCDIRKSVSQWDVPPDLSDSELAKLLQTQLPKGWTAKGPCGYSKEFVAVLQAVMLPAMRSLLTTSDEDAAMRKLRSRCSGELTNKHGISLSLHAGLASELLENVLSKLRQDWRELTAKRERELPRISTAMEAVATLEERISELYVELVQCVRAAKKLELEELIFLQIRDRIFNPLADRVFEYVARTQCGGLIGDREMVMKAIPNSVSFKHTIACLQRIDKYTDAQDWAAQVEVDLPSLLKDLQVVVPRKWKLKGKGTVDDLVAELDRAETLEAVQFWAVLVWIARQTGLDMRRVLERDQIDRLLPLANLAGVSTIADIKARVLIHDDNE